MPSVPKRALPCCGGLGPARVPPWPVWVALCQASSWALLLGTGIGAAPQRVRQSPCDPASHSFQRMGAGTRTESCPPMFIAPFFTVTQSWKEPKWPSVGACVNKCSAPSGMLLSLPCPGMVNPESVPLGGRQALRPPWVPAWPEHSPRAATGGRAERREDVLESEVRAA